MTFYLGTHQPGWLTRLDVPLCVSRRRLAPFRRLPRARVPWVLDSGGFSELSLHGTWTLPAAAYVAEVRRYRHEIGSLIWAAAQDWMCEPAILARTGGSMAEHQARTIANYRELRERAPEIPWLPVLQGWNCEDYLRHLDEYGRAGVDLFALPAVGLGSICRRQGTREVERIVEALQPLHLHAFGMKMTGLEHVSRLLVSADSMAWSYAARRRSSGCANHKNCANCPRFALRWRAEMLAASERGTRWPRQLKLF